jgi:hypothetical protein
MVCHLGHRSNLVNPPVEFEIVVGHGSCRESLFESAPNGLAIDVAYLAYRGNSLIFIVDNEACDTVINDLFYSAPTPSDDRCSAGHSFDQHQAVPPDARRIKRGSSRFWDFHNHLVARSGSSGLNFVPSRV